VLRCYQQRLAAALDASPSVSLRVQHARSWRSPASAARLRVRVEACARARRAYVGACVTRRPRSGRLVHHVSIGAAEDGGGAGPSSSSARPKSSTPFSRLRNCCFRSCEVPPSTRAHSTCLSGHSCMCHEHRQTDGTHLHRRCCGCALLFERGDVLLDGGDGGERGSAAGVRQALPPQHLFARRRAGLRQMPGGGRNPGDEGMPPRAPAASRTSYSSLCLRSVRAASSSTFRPSMSRSACADDARQPRA
jgi:hypothetical protein